MSSKGKPKAKRHAGQGRDGLRALIVCFCLAPLVVLGLQLSRESLSQVFRPQGQAQRQADDELKTGSLLFVPPHGDQCRRRVIDNATWLIADEGLVDCKSALAEIKARIGPQGSARLDVIRSGFRKD
jgi:hypothetical protein